MKINLAKSAGFCFGVRRAIDLALKTASGQKTVCMLGDIVHNENVVARIKKSGILKINRLARGKGKILLIRAHGCSKKTLEKAKSYGYEIVDATCPMVKEIHAIVQKLEKKGFRIIVIGDKSHDEVKGISGQIKSKALIIDKAEDTRLKKLRALKKAGIVVQSTQNLDRTLEIAGILRRLIPKVEFHNTICLPTRTKQNEIKSMPLENDIMLIIGSKTSANTRRLYEISRSLNKKSYRVNSAREIRKEWLRGAKSIGVSAGASTPESIIRQVIQKLKALSSR
ncbi:MAG: 4-hydroxy-3-methylbut-2-enyl diphosphate reductase [Candidatus Omnitrophica bacterium]|nr:4-hydroxy-3-methylbut-2-enyl diphosphate reductase [Candidatus Omnitrophota bacterium]MDD5042578.1 4-hydroxy-3-methylbut-2-enyl diphosphate reductase [Candidatus Omnitrophota bacterium]MDD5501080.1 4-hydroxy-3-methylbut-2-enyl diphosphate reductase [Candidatus Omnitrophota bacterium]